MDKAEREQVVQFFGEVDESSLTQSRSRPRAIPSMGEGVERTNHKSQV